MIEETLEDFVRENLPALRSNGRCGSHDHVMPATKNYKPCSVKSCRGGHTASMPTRSPDSRRRTLAPVIGVASAALVFAIVLILVRIQWPPLESADHGAAADLNRLVSGRHAIVSTIKAVTWLGSNGVLWTV
ncbi:MAG TPA: hypothetical protein VGF84_04100, partial [Micromonosporaceae bacterium]